MGTAKEYLCQIIRYDTQINNKLAEVGRLSDLLTRVTPVLKEDGASHGGGSQDRIATALAKALDLKEEINQDIDHLVDLKKAAYDLLNRVENPQYVDVLHRRYFLHQSFEKIAVDLGYTYRNICYIHGKALVAFGEVLEEERKAENEKE